ncbi:MAG: Na+/H+ antiporter NhaA [Pseudomonadota bacterium]
MTSRLEPAFSQQQDLIYQSGASGTDVVVFIDYTEPRVKRMRGVIGRSAERFRKLDVSLAYRLTPSPERGEPAVLAARAAIAAARQGRFTAMHDALFDNEPDFTLESVRAIAEQMHLDLERFEADMFDDLTDEQLDQYRRSASASVDASYTPMLFINGIHYVDSWDDSAILDAVRGSLGSRLSLASTRFFDWAASASLVLLLATAAAFAVVNFGPREWYEHIREAALVLSVSGVTYLDVSFETIVNDGLMALFFLVVGIEIKREFVSGELADPSTAVLPILGAIGGMAVPALLYSSINAAGPAAHGWGVPIATDIAFVLGILALLGDRVPASLKVFISALAIADDIGAIVIIALFYGHGFDASMFAAGAAVCVVMFAMNLARIYSMAPYMILGVILWYFILQSGVHATLAGVLTAFAIPSRPSAQTAAVAAQASSILDYELKSARATASTASVLRLQRAIDRLREPGFHLQYALQNWNSYLILPLFAFVNMGIVVVGTRVDLLADEVIGTVLGLALGKPLGICLAVLIAVKTGLGRLSSDVTGFQLAGAASLAGIGFTMSIFIASAAFEGTQLQAVKIAVLIGSALSAFAGIAMLTAASARTSVPRLVRG